MGTGDTWTSQAHAWNLEGFTYNADTHIALGVGEVRLECSDGVQVLPRHTVEVLALFDHDYAGMHLLVQLWDHRRQHEPDRTWEYALIFYSATPRDPGGCVAPGESERDAGCGWAAHVVATFPNWQWGRIPWVPAAHLVEQWCDRNR